MVWSAGQIRTKVRQCPVVVWQGEEAITEEEGLAEQPQDSRSLHLTLSPAVRLRDWVG